MNVEEQRDPPSPWILFPEVIGISVLALLLLLPLFHMLLVGQVLAGIAGFAFWLTSLVFAVRFMRRRQYGLAYFPMLAMVGLYFIIRKLCL